MTPPRLVHLGAVAVALAGCHAAPPAAKPAAPPPPPLATPTRSLVTLEATGLSRLASAAGDADYAVRLRVTAPPLAGDARAPVELALVLDTSGSMEGDAIAAAGAAARRMIERMGPRDRVAVVGFGSTAQTLVPLTELDDDGRAAALAAVEHLRATGTTDLAGGLASGLAELTAHDLGHTVERIVLLSDGVPNDGTDLSGLVAGAARARIAISTLGVGLEFDEALLGRIASDTGGAYRYAPDADGVARMFEDEVARMETVVAQSLSLTVRPGPGVLLGDAPWLTAAGPARTVFLGDLAAGETRDVFVPVRLGPHADGASIEVIDADLVLYDPATAAPESRHAYLGVKASADRDAVTASIEIGLPAARARSAAAGVILQAIGLARNGQLERAEQLLVEGERSARAAAEGTDDAELAAMARRMGELRKSLVFLRAAQTVAVPPVGGPPLPPRPQPTSAQPGDPPEAMASDEPYPLDRRPTEQAPEPVEAVIKDAYTTSAGVVFHP